MKQLLSLIDGKKSYLTALAMIIYALLGLVLKELPLHDAMNLIFAALSLIGLRSALAKGSNLTSSSTDSANASSTEQQTENGQIMG